MQFLAWGCSPASTVNVIVCEVYSQSLYTHAGLPAPGRDVPLDTLFQLPLLPRLPPRPPPLLSLYTHPALFSHPPAIPTWEGPFLSPTPRSSSGSFLTYFHIFHWPTGSRAFALSESTLQKLSLLHPTASAGCGHSALRSPVETLLKNKKNFISLLQTLRQAQS